MEQFESMETRTELEDCEPIRGCTGKLAEGLQPNNAG
jgi:hypothetical protein